MKYKNFIIRICNLLGIVVLLAGYNALLKYREQVEENQKLQQKIIVYEAEKESASQNSEEQKDGGGNYADGTYEGEGEGFGGPIQVETVIADGAITDIRIVSAKQEDSAYLDMAEKIIDEIIEKQTAEVDTISGATYSSTGIKNAVIQALEKAVQ